MLQRLCEICGKTFTENLGRPREFCPACSAPDKIKFFNTIVPDEIVIEFLIKLFSNGSRMVIEAPRGRTWLRRFFAFVKKVRAKMPTVTTKEETK